MFGCHQIVSYVSEDHECLRIEEGVFVGPNAMHLVSCIPFIVRGHILSCPGFALWSLAVVGILHLRRVSRRNWLTRFAFGLNHLKHSRRFIN